MNTCDFIFFKNTPLNDFFNTIHFSSDSVRDAHFLEKGFYETIKYSTRFNFIRDRGTLDVSTINSGLSYSSFKGVNYCTFVSDEENTRYYAYVLQGDYKNPNNTSLHLLIDPVMTYTQGFVLNTIGKVNMLRQHYTKADYKKHLLRLRTNGDILKTTTKRYVYNNALTYSEFYVVFTCACDLSEDFGTKEGYELKTSSGITYDNITSPLDIYVVKQNDFNELMGLMRDYPWITQNIKKVLLLPKQFINEENLYNITMESISFDKLMSFKNGTHSKNTESFVDNLSLKLADVLSIHDLDSEDDLHLLRNEYTTLEYYTYDGQSMILDPAFIDDGIFIYYLTNAGYNNEFAYFPFNYQSDVEKETDKTWKGAFLNNAIYIKNFDEIPVLVDNSILTYANTANQRQLNESRQISSRLNTIISPDSSVEDRFYNIVSVMSSGLNVSSIAGKFSSEYEFYRTQKAEFADMAMQSPTISDQSHGNSFLMANDIWGITLKIASINSQEWEKVKKYYKSFGYEQEEEYADISLIDCMTICNYLKFSGQWNLPNVDIKIMEQLRLTLENGVRFWHDDGTANPMNQDILENKMRY